MAQVSKTNKYYDSDGNSYTQSEVKQKVREAKALKLDSMQDEYGYVFCEENGCGKNESCGEYLDCSHTISEKEAKEKKQTELCWDWQNNIKIRCRTCHKKLDKLFLCI